MGSSFTFIIPKYLSINSVIFDALDSSLLPTESWLNENSRWCTLNSDKTLSINIFNPSPPVTWEIKTIQTEECKTAYGSSLFQFGYSDILSNINGVGTLSITNWVFQNFFYSFNSFIGLENGNGKIEISGTTFDKFSNCGSIIRDTAEYPNNLDYTYSGLNSSTSATYRDSMFTSNFIQNKYNLTPSRPCQDSNWAFINISSSTFQNFNYMKTGDHSFHKVNLDSNMRFQGIILSLSNFYGTLSISGNRFVNLKFAFNNCEVKWNSDSVRSSDDIWGSSKILQAKTIIYVNVKSSSVEVFENTFSNWNSLLGLIYLQRSSAYTTPILIHNNTFSQNSAIIGANVIKLYMYTNVAYTTQFNQRNMIWAGVQISNNIFRQNIGWYNTIGTIQSVCYTDDFDTDPSLQNDHYTTPKVMSLNSYENLSKQGIILFKSINTVVLHSSLIPIDLNKFLMTNNIFDENFAGSQAGVVELINIRKIDIVSDSYINNGGIYKEALDKYGAISSTGDLSNVLKMPGAFPLFVYYGLSSGENQSLREIISQSSLQEYYSIAPLVIDGSFYISTSGLNFENNYMPELTQSLVTSFYPSNAITFRRSQGNLYLNSLTIQNYKGFDFTKLQSIFDTTNILNINTANPSERYSTSNPINKVIYPSFVLDYGFKHRLIRLAKPSTNTVTDFQNYFDIFELNNLTLSNLTHYDPVSTVAMFIDMSDDCIDVSIKNFTIKDIDVIQGSTGMFVIWNHGSMQLSERRVTNFNYNAYSFNITNYTYDESGGGVFVFNSLMLDTVYKNLTYFVSNVTLDKLYGKEWSAFYFWYDTASESLHKVTINITSVVVSNSFSYKMGVVWLLG